MLRRTSPAVVSLSFFDASVQPVQQIVLTNAFVVPSELPWRNSEDRELLLSGLRIAMDEKPNECRATPHRDPCG